MRNSFPKVITNERPACFSKLYANMMMPFRRGLKVQTMVCELRMTWSAEPKGAIIFRW
jgi:hypothetical protein